MGATRPDRRGQTDTVRPTRWSYSVRVLACLIPSRKYSGVHVRSKYGAEYGARGMYGVLVSLGSTEQDTGFNVAV